MFRGEVLSSNKDIRWSGHLSSQRLLTIPKAQLQGTTLKTNSNNRIIRIDGTDASLVRTLATMRKTALGISRRYKAQIRIRARNKRCKWGKTGWTSPHWSIFRKEHPSWPVHFPFLINLQLFSLILAHHIISLAKISVPNVDCHFSTPREPIWSLPRVAKLCHIN